MSFPTAAHTNTISTPDGVNSLHRKLSSTGGQFRKAGLLVRNISRLALGFDNSTCMFCLLLILNHAKGPYNNPECAQAACLCHEALALRTKYQAPMRYVSRESDSEFETPQNVSYQYNTNLGIVTVLRVTALPDGCSQFQLY